MSHPRGLSAEEAEAWERLAATVTPIDARRRAMSVSARSASSPPHTPDRQSVTPMREPSFDELMAKGVGAGPPIKSPASRLMSPAKNPEPLPQHGLDSHWDRKLKAGQVEPDFSLDLHGHTLDSAWQRLDSGLFQAKAMGARLVLLVTGKPRPVDAADRGTKRGAIRAKVLDWLAAGPHGSDIAAIRTAHRKHGGDGALYLVLRRR
ncbi:Smr/MutS family protein [Parerythrobacter lacustris]|uniref:Smr/MutS family protein n=1 Tax=Parerythrobacter lacustris TaxID=2969984 RepID=A0ABT1XM75_9SPHN|nr:Smr/MutS family protein [Parerythrobacter lacustris]MCR2832677.1 Smr/MutS family protein [Parerythrobacter lacustris]